MEAYDLKLSHSEIKHYFFKKNNQIHYMARYSTVYVGIPYLVCQLVFPITLGNRQRNKSSLTWAFSSERLSDWSEVTQLLSGEVGTWTDCLWLLCITLSGSCHVRNVPIFQKGTRPVPTSKWLPCIAGYSPNLKLKVSFSGGFPDDLFGNDLKYACW